MKRLLLSFCLSMLLLSASAQGLKGIIKNATKKDSTGVTSIGKIMGTGSKTELTNAEVIGGLKEALQRGTEIGTKRVAAVDGFFKDAAIKILMPEEAKKAEKTLRNIGMGRQVDQAILSMNRAAEDAAKSAAPIFMEAIKGMSFTDALQILKGGDFAATHYLKEKTTNALTEAFRPVIEQSLSKVDATRHWNTVFTAYNKFSAEKVNPDLVAYVTEKALTGIFYQLALEEQKIRKDPAARTTDLLKKVFGYKA